MLLFRDIVNLIIMVADEIQHLLLRSHRILQVVRHDGEDTVALGTQVGKLDVPFLAGACQEIQGNGNGENEGHHAGECEDDIVAVVQLHFLELKFLLGLGVLVFHLVLADQLLVFLFVEGVFVLGTVFEIK